MHVPNVAVPPDAPTVTLKVVSDPTAVAAVAFTRTVRASPSSATSDNAASPAVASCKDKSTRVPPSTIGKSTDVTVTADPPTDAEPDTVNFSPDSTVPSSGTVNIKVPLPDVPLAGMETVNLLPVKPVQASTPAEGHEDPKTAPPDPATVTATSVAPVKIDDEPLNRAVTVTCCAPACSSTDDKDNPNSTSASLS